MGVKYIWDRERIRCINVSQIQEFYFIRHHDGKCSVKGSITANDSFFIAEGLTEMEAEEFIQQLVEEIG